MKKFTFVFKDFTEWRRFLWRAVMHLLKGIARIIFAVVFGLWSLLVHAWRASVSWVGRYPNIALGGFIVVAVLIFVLMFARNRAKVLGLESQRDSIAWQYQAFKESHGYE